MKIAINGAGIAGTSLAYWLHYFGHEPVLIEQAPKLRKGGYLIDFWGVGYDIADKMTLIPELEKRGYHIDEIHWVNEAGKKQAGFDVDVFRSLAHGRYISIERSELAAAIYESIRDKVEIIFGDSISKIKENSHRLHVGFEKNPPRNFDLVIGADGLHSRVRDLIFGSIDKFEKDLGLRIAAFELDDYHHRNEKLVIGRTKPGRLIFRLSKRNDKTLFLLGFRDDLEKDKFPENNEERKAVLNSVYSDFDWEAPQILEGMNKLDDIYYDKVSQIKMEYWSNGRVALIGDAVAAVSLLAGEGCGLAMAEAYVLAGELSRCADGYRAAFARYERQLKTFVEGKQHSALNAAATFVPKTQFEITLRNVLLRLLPGSLVAKWGLGDLIDDIELRAYEEDNRTSSSDLAISDY